MGKQKSKPIRPSRAVGDITMTAHPTMMTNLAAKGGWTERKLASTNSRGEKDEGFSILERKIRNPLLAPAGTGQFSSTGHFQKNAVSSPPSGSPSSTAFSGNSGNAGAAAYGKQPKAALPPPPCGGGRNSQVSQSAPAGPAVPPVPAPGPLAAAPSISQIRTVQDMRMEDKSFCIAFDSEYYYDRSGQRYILSWQFAFVPPEDPGSVVELLVFSRNHKRLRFSLILNYIIEQYGAFSAFGCGNRYGVSYYSTRRWEVPVRKRNGSVGPKMFKCFEDAVKECDDPDISMALDAVGPRVKAEFDYVDAPGGRTVPVIRNPLNGYAVGYQNVYTDANRSALSVTLVCHSGVADISTLDFSAAYEKDVMLRLAQVQGGLVTLDSFTMHNPCLGKYYNFYPVRLTVRDTMCFAPAGKKKLEDLGEVIGVPKRKLPPACSKDDMKGYMILHPVSFGEYAINDALITLLYCCELWGCNTAMPVTVTSAAAQAAVPALASYFGLARDDRKGFDEHFRGLVSVKQGRSMLRDGFGYLQNTKLAPIDSHCAIFQMFAKNAYRGGYNGSIKIGYYDCKTYDYDLENAYLTCMALVPDIDWHDCIALEVPEGRKLTPMMVRSPFDPVFAFVDFSFPASVPFPCISQSVDGSMVFTRTGTGVYASAPELYLALCLGADVTVRQLFVGNVRFLPNGKISRSLLAVVKQFVTDRAAAQQAFGKGSLPELLLKIGGNGLYGKTAQNLVDKSSWSAMKEDMVEIGGSPITSPVHACLTTAGIRAVLLAAMNQLAELGYSVYSVTTDGFITDAPFSVLDGLGLYGFADLFRAARVELTSDPAMWQTKHEQEDLVNLTTRGNASLNVGDKASGKLPGVMAHNSFVTGAEPNSREDRELFLMAVLDRTDRVECRNKSFALFKDMARRLGRIDFYVKEQVRRLSSRPSTRAVRSCGAR